MKTVEEPIAQSPDKNHLGSTGTREPTSTHRDSAQPKSCVRCDICNSCHRCLDAARSSPHDIPRLMEHRNLRRHHECRHIHPRHIHRTQRIRSEHKHDDRQTPPNQYHPLSLSIWIQTEGLGHVCAHKHKTSLQTIKRAY